MVTVVHTEESATAVALRAALTMRFGPARDYRGMPWWSMVRPAMGLGMEAHIHLYCACDVCVLWVADAARRLPPQQLAVVASVEAVPAAMERLDHFLHEHGPRNPLDPEGLARDPGV